MTAPAAGEPRDPDAGRIAAWARIPYLEEPDYTAPPPEIPAEARQRMLGRLRLLYGEERAGRAMPELERTLRVHLAHKPAALVEAERAIDLRDRFTERDMVLITYGDMVEDASGATPLAALHAFVSAMNRGAVNTIHLLPFFPYSSDRGFSIVDFRRVDPGLGTWEDVGRLGLDYALMFDGVLNHCSARSRMFRHFLNGNPHYQDLFIAYDHPDDLTPEQRRLIFRPRTSDILTRFDTYNGPRYVWTTFSSDQVDLNFRNPDVLLRVVDGLLFYVRQGADILRLDAVTYLWDEPGTPCVHLPETHEVVKLLRDVLRVAAPGVALLTETNVPHADNVSYFGNGHDEAHMVYNFALPPLALHAIYTGDATALSAWARQMGNPSDTATFFNVLDTHDGIGLLGVRGVLPQEDIDALVRRASDCGAIVSYKSAADGTEEPYELNTTWWSAVNGDHAGEDLDRQVARYMASRSLALVIQGVPGLYAHGVLGSPSDRDLAQRTGVNRDVNRAPINVGHVADQLREPGSRIARLARRWPAMNLARTRERAFHPQGTQAILATRPQVFAVLRTSPEGTERVLAMTNVAGTACDVEIPLSRLGVDEPGWRDVMTGATARAVSGVLRIALEPYGVVWLTPVTVPAA